MMNSQNSVIFKLDNQHSLHVLLFSLLSSIYRYDNTEIFFKCGNERLRLYSDDFIFYAMAGLYDCLKNALDQSFCLHKSINHDIGYLCNEFLSRQNPGDYGYFVMEGKGTGKKWVGQRFLVWSCAKTNIETWLYSKGEKIFLHITPVYKWHFSSSKPDDKFVTYKEFIKKYEPYFVLEIKRDVAFVWLKKVENVIRAIEESDLKD